MSKPAPGRDLHAGTVLDGQGRGYAVRQSQSQKPYGPTLSKGLLAHRRPPPTSGGLNTSSSGSTGPVKTGFGGGTSQF